MEEKDERKQLIKERIIKDVFKKSPEYRIISSDGTEDAWIFDFRRILLVPEVLEAIVSLFWEKFEKRYPFQVGGIETSAIPLISAIVYESHKRGFPVQGFYVRKSRKKTGLLNVIEGSSIDANLPIILVDDLMNSGGSFEKTIKTIKDHVSKGCNISAVFSVMRYRDKDEYPSFLQRGIFIDSLFEMSDFEKEIGMKNISFSKKRKIAENPYPIVWEWKDVFSSYWKVGNIESFSHSKNALFVGTERGTIVSLDKKTGRQLFETRGRKFIKNNDVHSNILLTKDKAVFATLQGEFYVVKKSDGSVLFNDAVSDSIQNQIALCDRKEQLFFVRKYSFLRSRSEVVSFDVRKNRYLWTTSFPENVLTGPVFDTMKSKVVVILSSGEVVALSVKTGQIVWRKKLFDFGVAEQATLVLRNDVYIVTCLHKLETPSTFLFILDEKNGSIVNQSKEFCEYYVNEPVFCGGKILITSVSKQMFVFNEHTLQLLFTLSFDSRIFAKPLIVQYDKKTRIFVGTNSAKYLELDGNTFEIVSVTYFSERLLHSGFYDENEKCIYLRTQANQVFCLSIHKK